MHNAAQKKKFMLVKCFHFVGFFFIYFRLVDMRRKFTPNCFSFFVQKKNPIGVGGTTVNKDEIIKIKWKEN